jgi:hypothetical protein
MEPARRARVPKREEAVANVTRKTHRPDRRIRTAGDPDAEADRDAAKAAVKAAAKAGESDLNYFTV